MFSPKYYNLVKSDGLLMFEPHRAPCCPQRESRHILLRLPASLRFCKPEPEEFGNTLVVFLIKLYNQFQVSAR